MPPLCSMQHTVRLSFAVNEGQALLVQLSTPRIFC